MSTTAGGSDASASRSATASPSRSGSWMSRTTTSGCSVLTASIASIPPAASPITSNPPAWSNALAEARKTSWSSTISTVGRTPPIVPHDRETHPVASTNESTAGAAPARLPYRHLLARVCFGDELEDAGRGQVLLVDPHPEGCERVLDGVHDGGRCDDHAAFAHAAEVDVGVERHGLEVLDLDAGNVAGGRHQVVHERGRLEAAVLAVRRPLQQYRADALRDAAPDLALDHGGIDERAAVLDGDVPLHLHDASLGVDLDDRAVRAAGPAAFAAVVRGLDLELGGGAVAGRT